MQSCKKGNTVEYYSLNQYLKNTFGKKVYKIALDGGFTCPNRDGSLDDRGCIFCSAGGSGDFASDRRLSITDQIESGKRLLEKKIHNGSYIAYFQAYTNTYAPADRLEAVYMEAIRHPDIVAISIATRPDCLGQDVLDLLKRLNRIKPVWVELGLQTIHPETARYIRRGYELPVFDEAMKSLKAIGITAIVHIILGLPGESREMMLQSVDYVGRCGADGIKLQLLHVIKGTDLARDYEAGKFECMTMEAYTDLIPECIARLPEDMVIHRMTGDGDKKTLVAPMWSANKKQVLNTLTKKILDYTRKEAYKGI